MPDNLKATKKRSTYTMDEDTKKLADRVILLRTLRSNDKRESYSALFSNLIREEWVRQKETFLESDILDN